MALFLILVILISLTASSVAMLPLWRKVEALESMCEMLAKAVRGEYGKKEE